MAAIPTVNSAVPGIAWPGLPGALGTQMLAMQFQLEQSQWLAPADLELRQFEQLGRILEHAWHTVPYYRERLAAAGYRPGTPMERAVWEALPVLTRSDVQAAGNALHSRRPPPEHGPVHEIHTSGSTGRPVHALGTGITQFFWQAFTLREHLWQRRDLEGKLAAIRTEGTAAGSAAAGWGPATGTAFRNGPSALLSIREDVGRQAAWLAAQDPDYLITHPSNLLALCQHLQAKGQRLARLKQVRTFGETVTDHHRTACRETLGVGLADIYSAQEVGYIALQCPDHTHYHVQAESVRVEILDDAGRPCRPGEIGRVVLSTLHNFAMPLLRYELLDWAEVGPPCPCGRGLPVITRVLGRQRNLITLPDGRRHWPSFPAELWAGIGSIRQLQIIQHRTDDIEVKVVAERPLTAAEEERFTRLLQERFGHPFPIRYSRVAAIERGANHKYEDFVSHVAAP